MRGYRQLLLAVLILGAANAWGQRAKRKPHIGYLYPGGGRQGSTIEVTAGGQHLRSVTNAVVSGEGVRVSSVRVVPRFQGLDTDQRKELRTRLRVLSEKRWAELSRKGLVGRTPPWESDAGRAGNMPPMMMDKGSKKGSVELPDHPLLKDLGKKSLRELQYVRDQLLSFNRKGQRNAQLAEQVLIQISIDRDAAPGARELRLVTGRGGLTKPMCFQVGALPEMREQEPNDPRAFDRLPNEKPLSLPILLNGQVMPGDVDRFRFAARRGQQLVIETQARRLIPYLADAVPGWFQATLALYDAEGAEVAFTDDYRFNPDPVLFYKVPEDGEYELEIRDAIFRGREDFVYRVSVGEQPFITSMFPLGGRAGGRTVAAIDGWNLPEKRLVLDAGSGPDCIRRTALYRNGRRSNLVPFAVDNMAECNEAEPNDDTRQAQPMVLPRIINGRIGRPGDVDVFRVRGRGGSELVVEVNGRRLHSPLDSVLRLTDASGKVLEWNDDYMEKDGHLHTGTGWMTHYADSYLRARLPKDGVYYVQLSDARRHGGKAYAYRLRISPPQPDFEIKMTPSSIGGRAGHPVLVTVHAVRKDGFDGEIEVAVKEPSGVFTLSGARIPGGRTRIRMTLTAQRKPLGRNPDRPTVLSLEGHARIDGMRVSRPVIPVDDTMQAFLWRHLMPSQDCLATVVTFKWDPPPPEVLGRTPVRVAAGGSAKVKIKARRFGHQKNIELQPNDPPKGVTVQDAGTVPGGLEFTVKADAEAVQPGFADNLIVEAFTERPAGRKGTKAAEKTRRVSLGVLPAIPFEIVRR